MHPSACTTVEVTAETVSFEAWDGCHQLPRTRLPTALVQWLKEGRRAMYALLEGTGRAPFFSAHLPVLVTRNREGPFPFNTGNKGVGLAPVRGRAEWYTALYRRTFEDCAGSDWDMSLQRRLAAVRSFVDSDDVSDESLVGLEIFEGRTFGNLCAFPLATLHYVDAGPDYRSFQVDVVVQIVPGEHPLYQFAYWSRHLFEYDAFHITQTRFPYAYVFHPVRVVDKTPYARTARDNPGGERVQPPQWAEMTLVWEEAVLAQLERAPAFVQSFIIRTTEKYAREQGLASVGQGVFDAVRARYMNRTARSRTRAEPAQGQDDG